MGYAITIRNADDSDIPYARWIEVARADPELHSDGHSQWTVEGEVVSYEVFSWTCPDSEQGNPAFVYFDGRVTIDDVADAWVRKIGQVAHSMGSIAEGDDGETYDEDGREHRPAAPETASKGGFLARLFGRK